MKTTEPVRLYGAIMTGWLFLIGGAWFIDTIPGKVGGGIILVTGAIKVGVDEYIRSKVTPTTDPAPDQD